jgi:hypothetical protein
MTLRRLAAIGVYERRGKTDRPRGKQDEAQTSEPLGDLQKE